MDRELLGRAVGAAGPALGGTGKAHPHVDAGGVDSGTLEAAGEVDVNDRVRAASGAASASASCSGKRDSVSSFPPAWNSSVSEAEKSEK
ncbi:hypothetical protein AB0368_37810 [Actinoplanes sp. NPDC051475]|uniref:hypothetical protein n=1 Tax=Actinoplanes sp. NPDC051475 TaxID=3157225 RepID=UPI00344D1EBC